MPQYASNIQIPNLPLATSLNGTEQVEIVQAGTSSRTTTQPDGGVALRGNCAGIGYTYDQANDVFYAPQPYASWTLDQTTWLWSAPVPYPADDQRYVWDEATVGWKLVTEG